LAGVNVRHVAGKTLTISPLQITLSNRGEEYRVSHPYGSGEVTLNIVPREDLLVDLLCVGDPSAADRSERPFRERQIRMDSGLHFAAQLVAAAARSRATSALDLDETAILLIERMFKVGSNDAPARLTPRDTEIAQQTRAILAARYAQAIALQDVAASLGISVYHLCRVFRRATGATLWAEVQQLRTRAALTRLAAGERDLTALALALGYAHHSHFTAAFRRQLGLTPSAARRLFDTGSSQQVRRLLRC
jgi:AraC family transcriptional regulator